MAAPTPRNRGTCDNLLTIRRDVLEASVLSGLRTHLLQPELMQEFAAEYHRELNRLNAERDRGRVHKQDELAKVTRQVRAIIEAIKEGIRTPGMKDELLALEARKAELEAAVAEAPAPAPVLHPALAELYGQKVASLHEELNRPEMRAEATQALRGLVEEIRLVPEDGQLQIEIAGDLAGILALGDKSKRPARGAGGSQVTLVAGTRNHLYRTVVDGRFRPNSASISVVPWTRRPRKPAWQSDGFSVLRPTDLEVGSLTGDRFGEKKTYLAEPTQRHRA